MLDSRLASVSCIPSEDNDCHFSPSDTGAYCKYGRATYEVIPMAVLQRRGDMLPPASVAFSWELGSPRSLCSSTSFSSVRSAIHGRFGKRAYLCLINNANIQHSCWLWWCETRRGGEGKGKE